MALSRQFQTKTLGDNYGKVGVCCAVRVTISPSCFWRRLIQRRCSGDQNLTSFLTNVHDKNKQGANVR